MKRTLAITLLAALALAGCKSNSAKSGAPTEGQPAGEKPAQAKPPAPQEELYATFQTSMGNIVVRLFPADAPKTVANFVDLAKGAKEWTDPRTGALTTKPLYDGTIFHRVIPGFMIQGGDPLGQGIGGPGYKFEDEFQSGRRFDKPCLLAMANSGPNSNGSQFFITEKPTPWLSGRHTIFGEVVQGCQLVGQIANVPRGERDRPTTDVVIKHVEISNKLPQ